MKLLSLKMKYIIYLKNKGYKNLNDEVKRYVFKDEEKTHMNFIYISNIIPLNSTSYNCEINDFNGITGEPYNIQFSLEAHNIYNIESLND